MTHLLAGILALLQLLAPALNRQALPHQLRSGQFLRCHIIAHDDTQAMQRLKLQVRDAVQACYANGADQEATMLANAAALLPELTAAAQQTALEAGFSGAVEVELAAQFFGERILAGVTIPAGTYPALLIRLGDARGHNWWGLLDPATALSLAAIGEAEDAPLVWDWSWEGLLTALVSLIRPAA